MGAWSLQITNKRMTARASLDDAKQALVCALYESQRGYNLDDAGNDKGDEDRTICAAGTFNKLIEKVAEILKDCELIFISKSTAALKLPIIVREAANDYLSSLANPQTIEELLSFTQLIDQIKENGVDIIWDQIKQKVTDRMMSEFGVLFPKRQEMVDFVDGGKYSSLGDLSIFQQQIQNSVGYHEYCNRALHDCGLFSSRPSISQAQEAHDGRFSLVLRR